MTLIRNIAPHYSYFHSIGFTPIFLFLRSVKPTLSLFTFINYKYTIFIILQQYIYPLVYIRQSIIIIHKNNIHYYLHALLRILRPHFLK